MTEAWEGSFVSELSSCLVAVSVLTDGRLEVTFVSSDEDESWGERLSVADSERVAAALASTTATAKRSLPSSDSSRVVVEGE